MINFLIKKCFKSNQIYYSNNNSVNEKQYNDNKFINYNLLNNLSGNLNLSKLIPNVSAISDESINNKDNNVNNSVNIIANESRDQPNNVLNLKVVEERSFWENIKHYTNRKIDTNDENYIKQFVKEGETGWDRISLMWSEWSSGEDNPEVRFITSSALYGVVGGVLYGGFFGNATAVQDFMRRHNEYAFRGNFEGQRRIRDTMYIKFFTSGYKLGWRVGLFSALLSGFMTTAIAYRNDVYVRDCMASGAIVCSVWKMKLGLRAMVVSGIVGSIFGLIFAGSLKLSLKVFNTTVPEYRHWRHTRYLKHLEVKDFGDGKTEYKWNIKDSD